MYANITAVVVSVCDRSEKRDRTRALFSELLIGDTLFKEYTGMMSRSSKAWVHDGGRQTGCSREVCGGGLCLGGTHLHTSHNDLSNFKLARIVATNHIATFQPENHGQVGQQPNSRGKSCFSILNSHTKRCHGPLKKYSTERREYLRYPTHLYFILIMWTRVQGIYCHGLRVGLCLLNLPTGATLILRVGSIEQEPPPKLELTID